jgi:PAS domain S-box-containing protein
LNLRKQRRKGALSQEALARLLGMDPSYIGQLEKGGRDPALSTLFRLAVALRVRPARFMAEIDQLYKKREKSTAAPAVVLTKEMKRLRGWMDGFPIMMWFCDVNHKCLFVNQAVLIWMGVTFDQVAGDQWKEFIHPSDREAYLAVATKHYRRRQPYTDHYRLHRADDKYFRVVQRANPQFTPKGEFYGFMGAMIPDPSETQGLDGEMVQGYIEAATAPVTAKKKGKRKT